jgi:hypothetical protein
VPPKVSEEVSGGGPGFYFWSQVEFLEFGFVPKFIDDLPSLVTKTIVNLNDIFFMG